MPQFPCRGNWGTNGHLIGLFADLMKEQEPCVLPWFRAGPTRHPPRKRCPLQRSRVHADSQCQVMSTGQAAKSSGKRTGPRVQSAGSWARHSSAQTESCYPGEDASALSPRLLVCGIVSSLSSLQGVGNIRKERWDCECHLESAIQMGNAKGPAGR